MKTKLKNDLKDLTDLIGVSGSEQEVIQYLLPRLDACCDKVEVTSMGNVIAYKNGKAAGKRMVITAHIDEIGFAVKHISANGFIKFEKIGEFSNKLLPARKVIIQTETGRVPGVIGMRPAHVMTPDEAAKIATSKQSYIDVGATSKKEVEEMGVTVGSKIVFQSDFMEMFNPDFICTRAVDCRVGCAILLSLLEELKSEDFEGEIIGVFSVLEETTIAGMVPIYNTLNPDYTLVIDTVPCGDVPDVNTDEELPVYLGKGPVVIISQGAPAIARYACIHPRIREALNESAKELGIGIQELAISESLYITEANITYMCGSGIPSATVAIPRRFSHAPTEVVNINDAVTTYELLKRMLEKNGQIDLSFL